MWQFIDSGCLPPAEIMAKDQALLNGLKDPLLHFYEWEGECLTYGYFIKPEDHLNLAAVKALNLAMARRPTGGGIIFHLTDLAFSVFIPAGHPGYSLNTLDNYAYINQKVAAAIALFTGQTQPTLFHEGFSCETSCPTTFCMAQPTRYDVVVNRKKVGGAAQRRTRAGYLHQGSISLALAPLPILEAVLKKEIVQAMRDNTFTLLPEGYKPAELTEARQQLRQLLKHAFT